MGDDRKLDMAQAVNLIMAAADRACSLCAEGRPGSHRADIHAGLLEMAANRLIARARTLTKYNAGMHELVAKDFAELSEDAEIVTEMLLSALRDEMENGTIPLTYRPQPLA